MHAFMALFFYELVRDQIVFIWHAWAMVVGPQMIIVPVCRTMPSVLVWWWRRKRKRKEKKRRKRSYWPSDVKDRFLIICVYIFIYLIIYWRVLRPERRSRHWSLLQVLRRVATSQNSDWAKRQRLIHFSFFISFFSSCRWFSIQNAVKLKPCVHVQVVEIHANLVPGGVFFFVKMLFMQRQLEPLGSILERRRSLKKDFKKNPVK